MRSDTLPCSRNDVFPTVSPGHAQHRKHDLVLRVYVALPVGSGMLGC